MMRTPAALAVRALAVFATLVAVVGVAPARGEDTVEALERLESVARTTAAAHTGRAPADIEVRPIDPRVRLAACAAEPKGRVAPGTRSPARLTVEVRCEAPYWRQFVAIAIRAEESVVVAARPLARADTVAGADLLVVRRDVATLPAGYFREPGEVVGRIAQRGIGAGEVLAPADVRPAPVVKRGQEVTLIARSGNLTVRSLGVALADGGVAERVRVRNRSTDRQVEGVVRSSGTVEVSLE